MKLHKLTIKNFMAHRDLVLDWTQAPIALVCGPNRIGKSALREAIDFAIRGECDRLSAKGARPMLVLDGEKKGSVALDLPDGRVERDIKTGKAAVSGNVEDAIGTLASVPFMLHGHYFAALSPQARKDTLFKALGLNSGPDAIAARLRSLGVAPVFVDRIKPYLAQGFAAAGAKATEYAAEARGAWKGITGDTYGSVKAESWAPPALAAEQPGDADALLALDTELAGLRKKREEVVGDLAVVRHRLQDLERLEVDALQARQQLSALTNGLGEHATVEHMLTDAEQVLAAAEQMVTEATATRENWALDVAKYAAGAPPTLGCPCCSVALELVDGQLVEYQRKSGNENRHANAVAKFEAATQALQAATAQRDTAAANKATIEGLAQTVQAFLDAQELAADLPSAEELSAQQHRIEADGIDKKRQRDAIAARQAESVTGAERASRAAEQHAQVVAWTAVAEHLSPDGIPAEILKASTLPLEQRLLASAQQLGWPPVRIDGDWNIWVGSRPYGMESESGQWRADLMLQEAIAHLAQPAGARSLVIDRFDVLDLPSRSACLKWLHGKAASGDLDAVLLLATLKEPPKLPPTFSITWLG